MKDLEISKELLSKVLNIPKENIVDIYIDGNYLLIQKDNNRVEEHNIYEFTFKCKEWAFNNGRYVLESKSYSVKNYKFTKGAFCYTHFPIDGMGNSHWADTEVEAIIQACEWILKEQNNDTK